MPTEPVPAAESVRVPWDALETILDRFEPSDEASKHAVTICRLSLKWFHERRNDGGDA